MFQVNFGRRNKGKHLEYQSQDWRSGIKWTSELSTHHELFLLLARLLKCLLVSVIVRLDGYQISIGEVYEDL